MIKRKYPRGAVILVAAQFAGICLLTASAAAQGQIRLPGPEVAASATTRATVAPSASSATIASMPVRVQDESYRLGSGDKLRMIVYGEDDLGGEYLVDGSGQVQLPLLGQVNAAGMTVHDFEAMVGGKFVSEGYLKDPRVSVEIENYRPFYIIGEVKNPGQYPYVSGMNALNAVAMAGGYTYRADDDDVYIRRMGSNKEVEVPANQTTRINPGDIVRIDERMF